MEMMMTPQNDQELDLLEHKRIQELRKYDILDTPPDGSLDRLTKLASKLLGVPVAAISLVDTDRIWFKSSYGLQIQQTDRDFGLSSSAILSDEFYLVEDAATDPRTLAHPLVTGEFGLRFYAAVPLKTRDGYNLGTFCVVNKAPGRFTADQKMLLEELRDIAMDQIELKFAAKLSVLQHNQILNTTAHDLKNPLTTIPVRADLIKLKKHDPDVVDKMCDQIKIASLNMVRILDELLQAGSVEAGKVNLLLIKLPLVDLVKNVIAMNQPLADRKNQTLHFNSDCDPFVQADENKLTEIIDNLINNAIKYASQYTNIFVSIKLLNDKALIEVRDEGPGLSQEDMKQLYQRFTRLSAQPTGGEHSTGLGLSIVKVLVEAHGGRLWADSEGKGKGATFTVELPVREP